MNEVKIVLDDQEADFESSESLPLQLSKKTDNFFSIPGTEGMEIDNELNEITLPATKNNHTIYEQIALSHMMPGSAVLSKDTKIFANGLQIFSGSSILKNASVNTLPDSFSLELIGDSLVIWSELEGVGLRDLDMGVQVWDDDTVLDSWTGTYDTAWKGIFAPILYGKTSGTLTAGSWHEKDFKFSPYFRAIVDSIFNTLLGYSVVSTFFDTNFFKECAYVFGVGDDVKYNEVVQPVRVSVTRSLSGLATDPIEFNWESIDLLGEWNGTDTFTADESATFVFTFEGVGEDWDTLLVSKNGIDTLLFLSAPTSTDGDSDIFEFSEEFVLTAGDTVTLHPTGSGIIISSAAMTVQKAQVPWDGSEIIISSCLHDVPVKTFLQAISHMFNLAWRVNNTTKQVFVEPRLPYVLYESGTPVNYQGFYQRATDTSSLKTHGALSYDLSIDYPFGKTVIFGYAKNENDPFFDSYQAGNSEPLLPLFGVKKEFNVAHGEAKDILNPLFVPLFLCRPAVPDATGSFGIPAILPENYKISETELPSVAAGTTTYKGKPTCGIISRGEIFAHYNGTDDYEDMPHLSQIPTFITNPVTPVKNTLSYADVEVMGETTEDRIVMPGLISTFYKQYLQMANPASRFSFQEKPSLTNFASEEFHELKILQLNNEWLLAILLEIGEFNPVTLLTARNTLLKWVEATESEEASITHNDSTLTPEPRPRP